MNRSIRGKRWNHHWNHHGGRGRGNRESKQNNENLANLTGTALLQEKGDRRQRKLTAPCPFQKWSIYFPDNTFVPGSFEADRSNILKSYFESHTEKYPIGDLDETSSVYIDFLTISTDNDLISSWTSFSEDLHVKPESCLRCMAVALHQVLLDSLNDEVPLSYPMFFDLPKLEIRIMDYKPVIPLKNLKANLFGKLVAIKGTVVRVSNVKPLVICLAFSCNSCGEIQDLPFTEGKFACPTKCVSHGCRARSFTPQRSSVKTKTIDWQSIRVQELVLDENREAGRIPRTVECELTSDLVDSASPGDLVTVTGVVKVSTTEEGSSRATKDKCMFSLKIHANAVYNSKKTYGAHADEADQMNDFTVRELYAIQEIHKEQNLFRLIVGSLCPSIYGHELVKAGLTLALFGGNQRFVDDKNKIPVRGDPHVLVVGDPGLGKSQMLQAVANIAPRGVYVCGNTTTTSGLTVTLAKEGGSSDYALEAGALVLGDQGCCCIDEFDKMGQQHQALLEAMEQQSISIAKAGLVCSLPARTSILAAANPIGGHYNKAKTVAENLRMNSALLSRFDLVFILLDDPDERLDCVLSEHVMALHTGKKRPPPSSTDDMTWRSQKDATSQSDQSRSKPSEVKSLSERLKVAIDENMDVIPTQLLRKYITYARKYVNPVLSSEAAQIFQDFYLLLRRQYQGSSTIPITTRQLESLIRLGEARARLELRENVTAQDAEEVVEIMKYSMIDIYSDDMGHLDFNRSLNGSGMSKRKLIKRFVQELTRISERDYNTLFSIDQMRQIAKDTRLPIDNFEELLTTLNNQNYLLKKGPRVYQLQTASGL